MMTEELTTLSHFYEGIIENAESNVLVLDEQFKIVSLNPGFHWVFLEAFDVQLQKGAKLFELLSPTLPHVAEKWKKRCTAALKGISIKEEEYFTSHSQEICWKIYYKASRLGNSKYISMFLKNISTDKTFQNQFLNREQSLRSMINALTGRMIFLSPSYEVIEYNDQMLAYFHKQYGIRLQRNRNLLDLFGESQEDVKMVFKDRIDQVSTTGKIKSFLDKSEFSDKEVIEETRIKPIVKEKAVVGYLFSVDNISNKRVDKQLQRVQVNELLKLNNELDHFVYSTSHDLRSPLLSIMGIINLMKKEFPEDLYVKHIEASVVKLDNYVTNIVNYSRNNRVEVIGEKIDFQNMVSDIRESLSYLDGSRLVNLEFQYKGDDDFYSDHARLTMIMKNLMSNAFQFFDATKKPYLLIDISIEKGRAEIRVEDNGIGMKDEIKSRVFDMFFRGTDRSKGAGLGLYVVNNAVQKLNASINMKSLPGVGTIIHVSVPSITSR
jgi:signal transduction histidine kinase